MEFQNLSVALDEGILTVTVDRPKVLNALDLATLRELDAAFAHAQQEDAVRCVVVTGAGEKAFVAGADIKELAELSPVEAHAHARFGQAVFRRLEQLGKPSIAAINGYALGGGLELAMACTLRVASSAARLGLPEITLGILPGFGGTQRLRQLVGQGRALHMVLGGKPVKAARALEVGLVNEVVEPDELAGAARALATHLASFSAVTLRLAEDAVRRGADMGLDDGFAFEASQFGVAVSTEDFREGTSAFLGKRKPEFRGR